VSARGGGGATVVKDIAVDGYRVQAGSLALVGIFAVHRDPELWPKPAEFDPDRFSSEAAKARDRWQFIPFAGGSLSCIGKHFRAP
jgi:cytochrome P450